MTYSIYALRVRGEIEVRYIGQTGRTPEARISYQTNQARMMRRWYGNRAHLGDWLLDNDIEGIVIATAATRPEAHVKEREMVEAFAKLGHRLFNRWLVPRAIREALKAAA